MFLPRNMRWTRSLVLLLILGGAVATVMLILRRPTSSYDLLYQFAAEDEMAFRSAPDRDRDRAPPPAAAAAADKAVQ